MFVHTHSVAGIGYTCMDVNMKSAVKSLVFSVCLSVSCSIVVRLCGFLVCSDVCAAYQGGMYTMELYQLHIIAKYICTVRRCFIQRYLQIPILRWRNNDTGRR